MVPKARIHLSADHMLVRGIESFEMDIPDRRGARPAQALGGARATGIGRKDGIHSAGVYTELGNICIKR